MDEQELLISPQNHLFRASAVPDVLTVSKHFGGGITSSAVVTSAEIEAVVAARNFVFMHSHTADPLACGAGLASLEVIHEEKLWERAAQLGDYWQGHLRRLAERYELVGDVRGRGLIQGIELVWERMRKRQRSKRARRSPRRVWSRACCVASGGGARCCALCRRLRPRRASSIKPRRSLRGRSSG